MKFSPLLAMALGVSAHFSMDRKDNMVVYYGQGPNQPELIHFCKQNVVDVIVLSFVHLFPQQANGFPGTNFGNQCSGAVYAGPGYGGRRDPSRDALLSSCPSLQQHISICQNTYGKKVLLSLGGGTLGYQLNGAADGAMFANLLWFMFGPRNQGWVNRGGPRPFDSPDGNATEIDGFDLDIEKQATDASAGYIALVRQLRALTAGARKKYYLTGSPQCVVPDASMGAMLAAAKFDLLFIQFYNTPSCSAAAWVADNANYSIAGPQNVGAFTYDAWTSWLAATPSRDARLYIGLAGAPDAATVPGHYVDPAGVRKLASAHTCRANFGGLAVWDAHRADRNVVAPGRTYLQTLKREASAAAVNPMLLPCQRRPAAS